MAVVEETYLAAATWAAATVCTRLESALIDAGLMTAWHASFVSGGREHRVLEIIYNGAKVYGKTYYWFTVDGTGIWCRTSTGWNTTANIPSGPGVAGTQYVDWFDTSTAANNGGHLLLSISSSINVTITRATSGGRSFFLLRTGTTSRLFTIDPAGTTFKNFYNLDLGYHSGIYAVEAFSKQIRFNSLQRNRRELLLGSCLNGSTSSADFRALVSVSAFSIPVNFGSNSQVVYPDSGFALPGWTTASNPSAGANFNPVYRGLRLTSVHAADMPTDFGIASLKNSNISAVGDNANVTNGVEEYKIGALNNDGIIGGITSNPIFVYRTIGSDL
jgi:hypothetical protein